MFFCLFVTHCFRHFFFNPLFSMVVECAVNVHFTIPFQIPIVIERITCCYPLPIIQCMDSFHQIYPLLNFHAWIADELHIQREAPSTKRVN